MHCGSRWSPLTAAPSALVVEPLSRSVAKLSCCVSTRPRREAGASVISSDIAPAQAATGVKRTKKPGRANSRRLKKFATEPMVANGRNPRQT